MAFIYDLADLWNDGATTFTGIKLNVTDTASASGSLLMDLQVGGVSQFSVTKGGGFSGRDPTFGAFTISALQARIIFTPPATGSPQFGINFTGDAAAVRSFRIGASDPANADVQLYRDAAGTLAQRNSTNAQTFNIYNTYTDASNYERGFMKWNANVLEIGTEAAGTGSNREVVIKQAGQNRVTVGTNFTVANGVSNVFLDCATYFAATTSAASRAYAGNGFKVGSAYTYDFSSTTSAAGTADAGIKRAAAGQLQITNGSTGTGELIFIVPTSDPGITGALWNNAGTLSISA